MSQERINGPTPNGGEYMLARYVMLATMDDADEADADGVVITEYTGDDKFLMETVATLET